LDWLCTVVTWWTGARYSFNVRWHKTGPVLDDVKNYVVLLPSREIQNNITNWIDLSTQRLSDSISAAGNEIVLLQEFHTRLIADVVAGKLDVRAAAANLPETAELEPMGEPIEDDDLDETMDEAESEEIAA
jgi:type I restriction enzyme, S subunit